MCLITAVLYIELGNDEKIPLQAVLCIAACACHAASVQNPLDSLGFLAGNWRSTSSNVGAGDRFKLERSGHMLVHTSLHDVADRSGTPAGTIP